MTCGGLLPVVAIERADAEHDLRDFLLCRAIAIAVDALKHSLQSCALLLCQPRVGRNGPAVKGREQAIDRLKPVESLDAKGNEGSDGRISRQSARSHQLDGLATTEIMLEKSLGVVANGDRAIERWAPISTCGQNCGLLGKDDGAGIVLWKPEDVGRRRCIQRIDREIATPTAAGLCRSAGAHHSWRLSAPGNPCRRIRCGVAIPTRDRRLSGFRHACSSRANASRTHPVSSRSSLSP